MDAQTLKIDQYFKNAKKWQQELALLRTIVNDCGLTEDYKWRAPCYTLKDKNVVMLGTLKNACLISFIKGALLKDKAQILKKPGENTQAGRVIYFENIGEIDAVKKLLKRYIFDAIEIEKAGLKVKLKKPDTLQLPEELEVQFNLKPKLKSAFKALTPGRQKGYVLYFNGAKQSKTRTARIEKYTSRILDNKGFHDCVCGMSKKMPNCDGSHKFLKS